MPLSEEELRMLAQMERALSQEDPKFVSTLRGTEIRRVARRRLAIAVGCFALGVAGLLAGAVLSQPLLGVIGFLLMLGSAAVGVTAFRAQQGAEAPDADAIGGLDLDWRRRED